jgi:hypothetical protein
MPPTVFLSLALNLVGAAFCLKLRVTNQTAHTLFDRALGLLGRARNTVMAYTCCA